MILVLRLRKLCIGIRSPTHWLTTFRRGLFNKRDQPGVAQYTNMAGRNCYVLLCVLFVVMIPICTIIALVMCGIFVAAPALQGIKMLPTECTVVSSGIVGEEVSCRCGGTRSRPCFSDFPCLQINVTHLTGSGENITSLLVDTQDIMGYARQVRDIVIIYKHVHTGLRLLMQCNRNYMY